VRGERGEGRGEQGCRIELCPEGHALPAACPLRALARTTAVVENPTSNGAGWPRTNHRTRAAAGAWKCSMRCHEVPHARVAPIERYRARLLRQKKAPSTADAMRCLVATRSSTRSG
jgi:hypothetical protein